MARISVISGVCVEHDAISNAMRSELRALTVAGHEARLFAQHADCQDEVTEIADAFALAADEFYSSSDLAIFHFGVRYELFNALLLTGCPRAAVKFHNVTPPELLEGVARELAESSLLQLSIADRADEVWPDSIHNSDVLREWTDVTPEHVRVVELAVSAADQPRPLRHADPQGVVSVLYVGRLVPAKGLTDLIGALSRLGAQSGRIDVTLAGNLTFSDAAYVEVLRGELASLPEHISSRLLLGPSDQELAAIYGSTHVFVTASRHEGFCVPVIEALSAGCRVVTTNAGALPETVGDCGAVVAVGDRDGLADAIRAAVAEARTAPGNAGELGLDERRRKHLRRYSSDEHRARLIEAVTRLTG